MLLVSTKEDVASKSQTAGGQGGHHTNKKRASDSFESLDARAALPQNCSLRNVSPKLIFVNGPSGLELPTDVLSHDIGTSVSWLLLWNPGLGYAPAAREAGAVSTRFRPRALAA
jgi:hypothetical protein